MEEEEEEEEDSVSSWSLSLREELQEIMRLGRKEKEQLLLL